MFCVFFILYKNILLKNFKLLSLQKKIVVFKNYNHFLFKKTFRLNFGYKNNSYNFINFFKIIKQFDLNFLIFDDNLKKLSSFYIYNFGYYNVFVNKNFFFINKKMLLLNNWDYFYNKFLKDNKINCLIFFDYDYYQKFFLKFLKMNKLIFGLLPFNKKNLYFDYYLNYNLNNYYFIKLYLLNVFTYFKFKNDSFFLVKKKFLFLNNLLKTFLIF